MKKSIIIILIALLQVSAQAQKRERPNVLFLFADDQRADTIAAHGNPYIKTPNIDSLVRRGYSFRRNYVFGGNSGAVCIPSRAMLMTGKTWFKIDTERLNGELLLPELLQRHGYQTFATGKWHNGESSWLRAFQRGKSVMFGGMSDHTLVPVRDLQADGKPGQVRTGEKFSSELFADAAIEYLDGVDRQKPFFAYVAFTAPHDPRQPPPEWREMYYRQLPPLPVNFLPQLPFDNGMVANLRDENLAAWPRTEKVIRDQIAEYYGMMSHLDQQIGRILDKLKSEGLARNTIIIYAADNGLALGSHGLLGKQNVFEHSMRVPLIISGPGIPRGGSSESMTYLFDLFPTICDLAGVPQQKDLAGESLRPIWQGAQKSIRDSIFLPYIGIQRAVRDDRWKLIAYPKIGYLQLFDLRNDPHETTNLIDQPDRGQPDNRRPDPRQPDHRQQVERLLKLMKVWQERVGDTLEIPSRSQTPPAINLSGNERTPDQWQPDWIIRKYFGDAPPRVRQ